MTSFFPGRGPKDWTPLRVKGILEGLESLTASSFAQSARTRALFEGVVTVGDDWTLHGYHLTDEPEGMAYVIKQERDLSREKTLMEWPIGGILVSDSPERTWRFSPERWEPLRSLDQEDREYLESLIMLQLYAAKEKGQIVQIEYGRAESALREWRKTAELETLMGLPWVSLYGIYIPALAEENLPINPWRPFAVPVVFGGRYLRVSREAEIQSALLAARFLKKPESDVDREDILLTWEDLGWDGLLLTPHAYELEGVFIWNPKRILSYGTREESRRMGNRA